MRTDKDAHLRAPGFTVAEIGRSIQGRPIRAITRAVRELRRTAEPSSPPVRRIEGWDGPS